MIWKLKGTKTVNFDKKEKQEEEKVHKLQGSLSM